MTTEIKNDYSLLRPFDIYAAKRGDTLFDLFGGRVHFVDGPDNGGKFAVRIDGHFASVLGDQLRMAPLGWVEGRPVYKGDVLWHTIGKSFVTVENPISERSFSYKKMPFEYRFLTWTPPKREVKLLAWLSPTKQLVWIEEGPEEYPQKSSNWLRVPSEDKTVTVEERVA